MDESTVAYPVGRHVTVVNTESKTSAFVAPDHFNKVAKITCIALSPSKKQLAVAEMMMKDEPSQLSLFNLTSKKRTRTFQCPSDIASKEWVRRASGAPCAQDGTRS